MLGCEILFSKEQGEAMQDLVERTTGHPCPCKRGLTCPLLGDVKPVPVRRVLPVVTRLQSVPGVGVALCVAAELLAHAA